MLFHLNRRPNQIYFIEFGGLIKFTMHTKPSPTTGQVSVGKIGRELAKHGVGWQNRVSVGKIGYQLAKGRRLAR